MAEERDAVATVLVVDDDPMILETIALMLDSAGYKVRTATSGEECIRIALAESPALILLDVRLPGMNGNATAEALSHNAEARNIPIVMMTGYMEDADRIKALRGRRGFPQEAPLDG